MSHFCGLVIRTTNCEDSIDEMLAPYDENIEVPEYVSREVSDYQKISAINYYSPKNKAIENVVNDLKDRDLTYDEFQTEYVKGVLSVCPNILKKFARIYKKNGKNWNNNMWRYVGKKWLSFSTYNPNSKWDWYCKGGRWDKSLRNKDGNGINEGLLGDIDFKAKSDDGFYINFDTPSYCLIIDGKWYEKGEMGWCSTFRRLISSLPKDSEVTLIDFHI